MIHERDADVLETGVFLDRKQDFPPVKVSRRLRDGDLVEHGGLSFETIHCPGQSPGEVMFLVNVEGPDGSCRACFAGDAIGYKSSLKAQGECGYPASATDYQKTVPRLKEIKFDLYCGGHPHMVVKEVEGDNSPFISRDAWIKMVENRYQEMRGFIAQYPEFA